MVARNYFDHTSPGGETLLDRIKASTYLPPRAGYILGENIALGTMQLATPAAIVGSWMKSPGHRANILNGDFRDSGLGVVARAPQRYAHGQPRGDVHAAVRRRHPALRRALTRGSSSARRGRRGRRRRNGSGR